jgi:hypothetical protein
MGWVVNATSRPLYPRERNSVPILYASGWAPGSVWTDAENIAPTVIRSPDRPARSQSICRLSYTGPQFTESYVFQFAIPKDKNSDIQNYNFPVVLYGCETWSLTLREECRLRVFENRVQRVYELYCFGCGYLRLHTPKIIKFINPVLHVLTRVSKDFMIFYNRMHSKVSWHESCKVYLMRFM